MSVDRRVDRAGRARWTLHRAGILNVYQYDDEILDFAGGRLLLRGVNGSGKSTAMNMLLPFLLTARQRGIDAAGEQTGVLKSWMLSGRQEAQPVGYLWIEFAHPDGGHLTCGCGIKANRASDSVVTWWFVTDRRPAVDLNLVERRVPLSADALRAEIGSEAVFSHDRRADYRAAVRHRLFGGADLDQHLRLLDAVRNPRVGSQIDRELPEHLTSALPELSERALEEAARPLEDLDEHRRNVSALSATSSTLDVLCGVYRNYVASELTTWVGESRTLLSNAADIEKQAASHRKKAAEATRRESELRAEIDSHEIELARLGQEVTALRDSPAYRSGQELEDLRVSVTSLTEQVGRAEDRTRTLLDRRHAAEDDVRRAELTAGADHDQLRNELAATSAAVGAVRLSVRVPPLPPLVATAMPETVADLSAPASESFDDGSLVAGLRSVEGATALRRDELEEIRRLNAGVDDGLRQAQHADRIQAERHQQVTDAEADHDRARSSLRSTVAGWNESIIGWAEQAAALSGGTSVDAPTISAVADSHIGPQQLDLPAPAPGLTVEEKLRDELRGEFAALTTLRQRQVATAGQRVALSEEQLSAAALTLAELEERSEPEAPLLLWQRRDAPCLADLIDFAPELSSADRAGLEAALEASGLLQASLGETGLDLNTGELTVGPGSPVSRSLSQLVRVSVPGDWSADVDVGLLQKVLDSIAVEDGTPASGPGPDESVALVSTDGRFRVATMTGRHAKPTAEYIGAAARRATLERLRAEAAAARDAARAALDNERAELARCEAERAEAEAHGRALPTLAALDQARVEAAAAERQVDLASTRHREAEVAAAEAQTAYLGTVDLRDRTAATAQLPVAAADLAAVARSLDEVVVRCGTATEVSKALDRSIDRWRIEVDRLNELLADIAARQAEQSELAAERDRQASRLASLEDSLGLPYQEVLDAIGVAEADRAVIDDRLPAARDELQEATRRAASAETAAENSDERRHEAERQAVDQLHRFQQAVAVPGLLAVVAPDATIDPQAVEDSAGGLDRLVETVASAVDRPTTATTADGVRSSIRQRRDALGAGWDAEGRQPDVELPMEVVVEGPAGRMPLANARTEVDALLAQRSGLLTAQEDTALRDLLQGLVAREVAEKLDRANRLIKAMNRHLVDVTTAHGIGVELRWRRRPEIEGLPTRMVDLMAKLPDLRTDDEEAELRALLSARLDEARRLDPERSYRDLIAELLDYRHWYEMTILVRRGSESPKKLTPKAGADLSVGEKKLVTYLPFLAAVAVSSDALAEYASDAPRFVLLDDAAATVSEDNHADLLGLPVELDLDFIMTSERLWGTFATVPELSIVEVIRDSELETILLERAHWDGADLARELTV